MNYHVEVKDSKGKWDRIASFKNESDRGDCMDLLQDQYSDCEFRSKDDE